ncbi:hypothetical protein Ciccas_002152 [Cichlidogyrus casuarinus]|uniref:Uncharacterized protein n=1 Tax=Cichlidogyrus casuarinus TaxID=1844966 RepID=A0ABD2QI26_9PLAT
MNSDKSNRSLISTVSKKSTSNVQKKVKINPFTNKNNSKKCDALPVLLKGTYRSSAKFLDLIQKAKQLPEFPVDDLFCASETLLNRHMQVLKFRNALAKKASLRIIDFYVLISKDLHQSLKFNPLTIPEALNAVNLITNVTTRSLIKARELPSELPKIHSEFLTYLGPLAQRPCTASNYKFNEPVKLPGTLFKHYCAEKCTLLKVIDLKQKRVAIFGRFYSNTGDKVDSILLKFLKPEKSNVYRMTAHRQKGETEVICKREELRALRTKLQTALLKNLSTVSMSQFLSNLKFQLLLLETGLRNKDLKYVQASRTYLVGYLAKLANRIKNSNNNNMAGIEKVMELLNKLVKKEIFVNTRKLTSHWSGKTFWEGIVRTKKTFISADNDKTTVDSVINEVAPLMIFKDSSDNNRYGAYINSNNEKFCLIFECREDQCSCISYQYENGVCNKATRLNREECEQLVTERRKSLANRNSSNLHINEYLDECHLQLLLSFAHRSTCSVVPRLSKKSSKSEQNEFWSNELRKSSSENVFLQLRDCFRASIEAICCEPEPFSYLQVFERSISNLVPSYKLRYSSTFIQTVISEQVHVMKTEKSSKPKKISAEPCVIKDLVPKINVLAHRMKANQTRIFVKNFKMSGKVGFMVITRIFHKEKDSFSCINLDVYADSCEGRWFSGKVLTNTPSRPFTLRDCMQHLDALTKVIMVNVVHTTVVDIGHELLFALLLCYTMKVIIKEMPEELRKDFYANFLAFRQLASKSELRSKEFEKFDFIKLECAITIAFEKLFEEECVTNISESLKDLIKSMQNTLPGFSPYYKDVSVNLTQMQQEKREEKSFSDLEIEVLSLKLEQISRTKTCRVLNLILLGQNSSKRNAQILVIPEGVQVFWVTSSAEKLDKEPIIFLCTRILDCCEKIEEQFRADFIKSIACLVLALKDEVPEKIKKGFSSCLNIKVESLLFEQNEKQDFLSRVNSVFQEIENLYSTTETS